MTSVIAFGRVVTYVRWGRDNDITGSHGDGEILLFDTGVIALASSLQHCRRLMNLFIATELSISLQSAKDAEFKLAADKKSPIVISHAFCKKKLYGYNGLCFMQRVRPTDQSRLGVTPPRHTVSL